MAFKDIFPHCTCT